MSDGRSPPTTAGTILLIEDNPGDARLIEEAFDPALAEGLYVVSNGAEGLDFVTQCGQYADAPRPDLILLDWHLPDTNGEDVLAELKGDPEHDHIPVIVLTGARSESTVLESYKRDANACITKTSDPEELEETLRALEDFWLSTARLPVAGDGRT